MVNATLLFLLPTAPTDTFPKGLPKEKPSYVLPYANLNILETS